MGNEQSHGHSHDGNDHGHSHAEKKEERTALKDEVIGIAKQIGAMSNFKLLVIDTENKFVSTGVAKDIANAAGGRYHYIPKASADAMRSVTVVTLTASTIRRSRMARATSEPLTVAGALSPTTMMRRFSALMRQGPGRRRRGRLSRACSRSA